VSGLADLIRPGLRFAAVGHVTNDRLASGLTPGGSVFYAAVAAAALGAEVTAVTCCGPDWIGRGPLLQTGAKLVETAAPVTTSFENVYLGGTRRDRLLARAEAVEWRVPPDAQVVLACPVMGEIARSALVVEPGVLLGAGLQGWLRAEGQGGAVEPRPLEEPRAFRHCRVVFLSEEDLGEALLPTLTALRAAVPMVVLTRGAKGSTLFERGRTLEVRAVPAKEVDPTGAGDVYATAFLLALASGHPSGDAARTASAAAAFAVEAPGADGLQRLSALAEREVP
jgi:sugar/nucleoside kinase (ribokinase family)